MKNLKFLFAATAILTAGIAVYASNSTTEAFYRSTSAGVCSVLLTGNPTACSGSGNDCTHDFGGEIGVQFVNVTPTGDVGDCESIPKD